MRLLADLPVELVDVISSSLSAQDAASFGATCKVLHDHSPLWHLACTLRFGASTNRVYDFDAPGWRRLLSTGNGWRDSGLRLGACPLQMSASEYDLVHSYGLADSHLVVAGAGILFEARVTGATDWTLVSQPGLDLSSMSTFTAVLPHGPSVIGGTDDGDVYLFRSRLPDISRPGKLLGTIRCSTVEHPIRQLQSLDGAGGAWILALNDARFDPDYRADLLLHDLNALGNQPVWRVAANLSAPNGHDYVAMDAQGDTVCVLSAAIPGEDGPVATASLYDVRTSAAAPPARFSLQRRDGYRTIQFRSPYIFTSYDATPLVVWDVRRTHAPVFSYPPISRLGPSCQGHSLQARGSGGVDRVIGRDTHGNVVQWEVSGGIGTMAPPKILVRLPTDERVPTVLADERVIVASCRRGADGYSLGLSAPHGEGGAQAVAVCWMAAPLVVEPWHEFAFSAAPNPLEPNPSALPENERTKVAWCRPKEVRDGKYSVVVSDATRALRRAFHRWAYP